MSPAEEKAAADKWVGRMKELATRFATITNGMPMGAADRTIMNHVTELQFAQIATIEAALANGMALRSAVEVSRTIGAFATGVELLGQFPTGVPSPVVEDHIQTMGAGVIHAIATTVAVEGLTASRPAATLVEPTHSSHQTRQ